MRIVNIRLRIREKYTVPVTIRNNVVFMQMDINSAMLILYIKYKENQPSRTKIPVIVPH